MPREPKEPKTPSNTLNLAGSLPPAQHNGLVAILDALVADPGARRVAVVELYGLYDKHNTDDDTHQIIVRWSRIEPVSGENAETVQKLLDAARTERLGLLQFPEPGDEFGVYDHADPQPTGDGQVHEITSAPRRKAAGDGSE